MESIPTHLHHDIMSHSPSPFLAQTSTLSPRLFNAYTRITNHTRPSPRPNPHPPPHIHHETKHEDTPQNPFPPTRRNLHNLPRHNRRPPHPSPPNIPPHKLAPKTSRKSTLPISPIHAIIHISHTSPPQNPPPFPHLLQNARRDLHRKHNSRRQATRRKLPVHTRRPRSLRRQPQLRPRHARIRPSRTCAYRIRPARPASQTHRPFLHAPSIFHMHGRQTIRIPGAVKFLRCNPSPYPHPNRARRRFPRIARRSRIHAVFVTESH